MLQITREDEGKRVPKVIPVEFFLDIVTSSPTLNATIRGEFRGELKGVISNLACPRE